MKKVLPGLNRGYVSNRTEYINAERMCIFIAHNMHHFVFGAYCIFALRKVAVKSLTYLDPPKRALASSTEVVLVFCLTYENLTL
ncbi:hypothetical protein NDU88_006125 [Pleurodeles waltl]|uniref:Uncharacterized protein n=1 Tax=Pleurodeles waltl TaxID=8319 RepID=A0AAV7PK06_PLEWA|nr:hypothetical protein NDU88_006125 [Pleurodeles waltl]